MSLGVLGSLVVLPPLNCLVAACLGLALRRHRVGRWLTVGGLTGLIIFSLPLVSGSLIGILESGLNPPPAATQPPQAIVILSGDEAEIRTGDITAYRPGALTLEREQAGAALARRTALPILVTGGMLHPWSPPLATIMTASLTQDFNVPVKWQEDQSKDTWGNATFSTAMLHKAGITSVYLVTHAWHMKRALLAFRHAGMIVTAAPVAIDAKPSLRTGAFFPSAYSWMESYFAAHELVGWAWYAIRH